MSSIQQAGGDALAGMLEDVGILVRCESPSGDLDAITASAEAVASVGAARLGVQPERIVLDGVTHLRWRFGEEPRRVLLLGHHDTVWPQGTISTHPFSVIDGVIRGPGCFDMKAGIVMAFHAVAALADRDGVTILITGDEEVGSPTSRELIEAEADHCRGALVLESSADGGALKTQRKGVSQYELRVFGLAAHAGLEPEAGTNATIELAHQVLAIAGLSDVHSGTTVTPTLLSSGVTRNTVPAYGSVSVDVRVRTRQEQQRVDRAMRALRPVVRGARLELVGGSNRPPLERAASAELFARAAVIAARIGIPQLTSVAVGGASDGNFTAGRGVPTLDGLGAVGGGAHADHEHVLVAELLARTELIAGIIKDLLATGSTDAEPVCRVEARQG
jgi:glutamate carboxypeptidase